MSAFLKHKVKTAVIFIADFERAVAHEAKKRGFQGVVCGHIHHAEIRNIDGILYCNDGDWVESRSALVEHMDGRLEIVYWDQELNHHQTNVHQPSIQSLKKSVAMHDN
jgi:UDP-2,3-diacylglucosamine pyrophosphatase LpxH